MAKAKQLRSGSLAHDGFYLLHVSGGTEPCVVSKVYKTYEGLLKVARTFFHDRSKFREEYDSLFYIKISMRMRLIQGIYRSRFRPEVGSFTDDELNGDGSAVNCNCGVPGRFCPDAGCSGVIEEGGDCSHCGNAYRGNHEVGHGNGE